MVFRIVADPRIDPRIKDAFGGVVLPSMADAISREELLAYEQSPEGNAEARQLQLLLDASGGEEVATFDGLSISTMDFQSAPDGNNVRILVIRPDSEASLPGICYLHGGGMLTQSCFDGNYSAWGRMIAAQGVVVAMVDFRNALRPSSAPEVAPYPAGLNDCVSAVRWLRDNADQIGLDLARLIVAGDSGGANLAFATALKLKRDGDIDVLSGIFALAPFISGIWPRPDFPSSISENGLLVDFHTNRFRMGYGIEAFEARDPLAWPAFATSDDVAGLPPVVISLNECDPARDEGIALYRLLLGAGVSARCRQVMGTIHATEIFPGVCPNISRDTAATIARFASSPE